ncbi:uncharacterized protein LOC130788870 isoform X2 [Actinidia eriantha]|uniref:uncharacterized protein LOC130788870 isoform X2 n=1 Tax=Actinidia eriantha TaxID=165200 RepID=UPI00258AC18D|nr:uncharacterized protein LOC130788870 isoform X2 [Actinidia eriantha]
MASGLLKITFQTINTSKHASQLQHNTTPFLFLPLLTQNHHHYSHLSLVPSKPLHTTKILPLPVYSSLSSSTPPTTKEEAILQAKTSLSTTLEKPLNNPKLAGKLKKLKQPRFRVEIPVIDDSPESLSQLALKVFGETPMRRKGSPVKILILWPNSDLKKAATKAFDSLSSNFVQHLDISSVSTNGESRILNSADVAVFLAPEASQLAVMRTASDSLYPKPVVIFNPRWGFEEESSFGELSGFVGSFEVVYSFMGLEVRGVLRNWKGVIFKCVRDGVVSGERWEVLVEEEGKLKVVSKFKARPSITEVETVLYNVMAMNSPITKSAKFLKNLVSNVTGKNS